MSAAIIAIGFAPVAAPAPGSTTAAASPARRRAPPAAPPPPAAAEELRPLRGEDGLRRECRQKHFAWHEVALLSSLLWRVASPQADAARSCHGQRSVEAFAARGGCGQGRRLIIQVAGAVPYTKVFSGYCAANGAGRRFGSSSAHGRLACASATRRRWYHGAPRGRPARRRDRRPRRWAAAAGRERRHRRLAALHGLLHSRRA